MHHLISLSAKTQARPHNFSRTSAAVSLIVPLIVAVAVCNWSLSAQAADGDYVWAKQMGGSGSDIGNAILVDGSGNIYAAGTFQGTVDFDPGPGTAMLTAGGGDDVFVTKFDSAGTLVWARMMGGSNDERALSVALDHDGNVYTAGNFAGTADFDPGVGALNLTAFDAADIFVSKLDNSGALVWAKQLGGPSYESCSGVAVDSEGNVLGTGSFMGAADFDPGLGTFTLSSIGGYAICLFKLDSAGNFVWAKQAGGGAHAAGTAVSLDDSGNVYATGYFQATVDFDPGAGVVNLTAASSDVFVLKLDNAGSFVWVKQMGGTSDALGNSLAVDGSGDVYTTGYFTGTADFDPGSGMANMTAVGGGYRYDVFLTKLTSDGDFVWANRIGGPAYEFSRCVTVDDSGNVYHSGYFEGTVDFDPGAGMANLTAAAMYDAYVTKLSPSGTFIWAKQIAGYMNDFGQSVAVDGVGNVFMTGYFGAAADFDPGPSTANLTSNGSSDAFLCKFLGPDLIPPRAVTVIPATTGPTNADTLSFSVVFDEAVQGFNDAADIVFMYSGTASSGLNVSGGPMTYTVDVSGITGEGTFMLAVNTSGDVRDIAGNSLASSVTSAAVNIDNTPPGFTAITAAPSLARLGQAVSITFVASESLDVEPVVAVNGHAALYVGITGSDYAYAYTVLGSDPDGPVTIDVSGSDAAGNTGSATDGTVLSVDSTAPQFAGITSSPSEAAEGTVVQITFTVSEPAASDPDVTVNGHPATRLSGKSGFNYEYTVQNPSSDPLGSAEIIISGADAAGNMGTVANNDALTITTSPPSLPAAGMPCLVLLVLAAILGGRRQARRK